MRLWVALRVQSDRFRVSPLDFLRIGRLAARRLIADLAGFVAADCASNHTIRFL